MMQSRQQEAEQLQMIQSARLDPVVRAIVALLECRLAKTDLRLRRCPPDESQKNQGEALAYEALIKELNTPPR
jgi:hypothetical protein